MAAFNIKETLMATGDSANTPISKRPSCNKPGRLKKNKTANEESNCANKKISTKQIVRLTVSLLSIIT